MDDDYDGNDDDGNDDDKPESTACCNNGSLVFVLQTRIMHVCVRNYFFASDLNPCNF